MYNSARSANYRKRQGEERSVDINTISLRINLSKRWTPVIEPVLVPGKFRAFLTTGVYQNRLQQLQRESRWFVTQMQVFVVTFPMICCFLGGLVLVYRSCFQGGKFDCDDSLVVPIVMISSSILITPLFRRFKSRYHNPKLFTKLTEVVKGWQKEDKVNWEARKHGQLHQSAICCSYTHHEYFIDITIPDGMLISGSHSDSPPSSSNIVVGNSSRESSLISFGNEKEMFSREVSSGPDTIAHSRRTSVSSSSGADGPHSRRGSVTSIQSGGDVAQHKRRNSSDPPPTNRVEFSSNSRRNSLEDPSGVVASRSILVKKQPARNSVSSKSVWASQKGCIPEEET